MSIWRRNLKPKVHKFGLPDISYAILENICLRRYYHVEAHVFDKYRITHAIFILKWRPYDSKCAFTMFLFI